MHWPQSFEWYCFHICAWVNVHMCMHERRTLRSAAIQHMFGFLFGFQSVSVSDIGPREQRETHCSRCFHLWSRRPFHPAASASSSPARWRAWSLSPSTEALKHTSQTQTRHKSTTAKPAHHQHSQKLLQCFFVAGFWVELHGSLDIIKSQMLHYRVFWSDNDELDNTTCFYGTQNVLPIQNPLNKPLMHTNKHKFRMGRKHHNACWTVI